MENKKVLYVVFGVVSLAMFVFGAWSRPGIDLTIEVAEAFVSPKETVYVAPKSEYEKAIEEQYESAEHQQICHNAAVKIVSARLEDKYLKEMIKADTLPSFNYDAKTK